MEFVKFIFLRSLCWVISIFLVPVCWVAALSFCRNLLSAFLIQGSGASAYLPTHQGGAFLIGVVVYALWHRFWPPEFLYAFVHEFTHLTFALITGKKVRRFEVTRGSGKVVLSGTNPIIVLAPYFFPLLTIMVLILGTLISWGLGYGKVHWATAFFSGLTLCLHVLMTIKVLGVPQPDIARSGRISSLVLIFLLGVVFVGGAALASMGGWSILVSYLTSIWHESWDTYAFLFGLMKRVL